ncbi:putative amino acid permease [Dictyobacter vulcani]|uniref:Putative amino acid permease n=1 Tax=Dictyobacter vulcani TaxID=2607529 RepID=A0A5J4KKX4_9CHLR|nr:APC family permease [Dictyobacter vulcani]GER90408.1 putative amino acid permease [Dictyobacter vulcani]
MNDSASFSTPNKRKPTRSRLNVRDLVFYTIAGALGLDTLGAAASYGGQALFWILLVGLTFFIPYQLLMAELGSTFPRAGGVYEWGKMSAGRFYAAIAAMLYWIANPLWIGGTMFVTIITSIKVLWFGRTDYLFGGNKTADVWITIAIAAVFIWSIMGSALLPISLSKRISTTGAAAKLLLIGLFVVLALIFFSAGHANGVHMSVHDLLPSSSLGIIVSGIIPVMIFKWQGFEVQVNVGDEVDDPQRTVPRSMFLTGGLAFLAYVIPIVVTIFALNKAQITGSSGLLEAIANVTIILPGPVAMLLRWLLVPLLIVALGASGSTWMVSANRAYAVAAKDHVAPQSLARFNPRTNTPNTAIIVSGIIATCAMVLAVLINNFGAGTLQSLFTLVLGFTVSVNTMAYLFIFPNLLFLRYKQPEAVRPYRVPGGMPGAWIVSILAMFYTIIVSYFLLFPTDDAIKSAGVSRLTYESTQLIALGAIILLTIIFYLWGRAERRQQETFAFTPEKQALETPASPEENA